MAKYNDKGILIAPDKSWGGTEDVARKYMKKSKQVQDAADVFVFLYNEMCEIGLEAYETAPKTDSLYGFSPISQERMTINLRQYMAKKGGRNMQWIGATVLDVYNAPEFTAAVKEACLWLLKFKPKKDVESIT